MKQIIIAIIFLLFLVSAFMIGCTEQERAKYYGGNSTVNLEPNMKLINVTWKEADIWYLTKPMNDTDKAETYYFTESSSYGVWEGRLKIVEIKKK